VQIRNLLLEVEIDLNWLSNQYENNVNNISLQCMLGIKEAIIADTTLRLTESSIFIKISYLAYFSQNLEKTE
jgi:hypothetical protein